MVGVEMQDRLLIRQQKVIFGKYLYTVLVLAFIFLLSLITLPGVNPEALQNNSGINDLIMLSMLAGGNLNHFSMMSIGLSTFVTAQIIMQLLQTNMSSKIAYWSKSGNSGRYKLNQLTKFLALGFCILQGIGIIYGINVMSDNCFLIIPGIKGYMLTISMLTAGTFIEIWLADRITEKGIGNGVAMIIAANIITQLPNYLEPMRVYLFKNNHLDGARCTILVVFILLMAFGVEWINDSEYQLTIQYMRREYFAKVHGSMPMKVIVPGVMPVIFASSILSIVQTILVFNSSAAKARWYQIVKLFISFDSPVGILLYGILIFAFTFIYSPIQIDPHRLSEELQKQEAYIPGVNPGYDTESYVKKILNRLSLPGAIALTLIAVGPIIVSGIIPNGDIFNIGGTSLLIIAGAFSEVMRQTEGIYSQASFEPFLTKTIK